MREHQLVADALHRLIEPEACFDAHDQQVEGIGQRQPNLVLPPLLEPRQNDVREQIAEPGPTERQRDVGPDDQRRRQQREQNGRARRHGRRERR